MRPGRSLALLSLSLFFLPAHALAGPTKYGNANAITAARLRSHLEFIASDELQGRDPGQRVDLFLCGHTHGGQVRLPFWGAVITLSKYHKRFESGLYDFEGVPMYVNRGVGCEGGSAPRVRFLCRPEVAVIDLVSKN